MRVILPLLALLLGAGAARAADVEVVETEHYRLEAEAGRPEAEAFGRLLEAAHAALRKHFGKSPDKQEHGLLRVRFFATKAAWQAGMRADGLTPPTDAGGFYAPARKTAYLFRQPTAYFTRVLLVHEATHQFHYLACTGNESPSANWYTEGVAEFLSWHTWDGKTIALGVRPWITLKDHAKTALDAVKAEGFDVRAIGEGRTWPGYPVAWALFRYLATGRGGKPLRGFDAFCRKMDRGGTVKPLFRRYFKGTQPFRDAFVAWLEAQQQPWAQVHNEWEDAGAGRLRGHAGVVSLCRVKGAAERVAAGLEVPADADRWCGGLVLHYGGSGDYVVALLDSAGHLRIDRRGSGRWTRLASHRVTGEPSDGIWQFEARREKGGVMLRVGGRRFGPFDLPPSPMGLAVDASDLKFRDVAWDLTSPDARGK